MRRWTADDFQRAVSIMESTLLRALVPRVSTPILPLTRYSVSDSAISLTRQGARQGARSSNRLFHHIPARLTSSRSPSPGPSPISGTLAVIKAQAFGALRKTRGRKKGDDAARMAKEALEARGISLGVPTAGGTKRQRTRYEEDDSS